MTNDLPRLVSRIHELLDIPDGAPTPLLGTVEHTLTDGYARALALEGETMRIEREIGKMVATIKDGNQTRDLPALAGRLARTEDELLRLRELLARLRGRAETLRSSGDDPRRSRSEPRTPQPGYGYRSAAS
ncbi:MAG: hypothetical protein M3265_06550 [Actinomycetota bacterium]|jgi:hypothetical protein|nr:hypothetical protein [Actinomycetota bacterium]